MGLFDHFRKHREAEKAIQVKNEIENRPASSTKQVINKESSSIIPYEPKLILHDDLNGLIWIADGRFKNYNSNPNIENSYIFGNIRISWTFSWTEEPSLIYSKLSVIQPQNENDVPRPSYWPKYKELSPEQRWIYLKLLTDPYNDNIDIGFVFILYYGLERHLLAGDFDRAFDVILKLRDVHKNKSFQSYSANALILTAMMHQRGEKIIEFMNSLDKDYELYFSDNLFLICCYSFNIPLEPKDIMRLSKTFEFTNNNYIKKYPETFEQSLSASLAKRFQKSNLLLSEIITPSELSNLKYENTPIFANMSIINETIRIPKLCDNLKLKSEINQILNEAHEMTKRKIQLLRKDGNLEKTNDNKSIKTKAKKGPIDPKILNDLPETASILDKHFHYIEQIRAFYERRDENEKYLQMAIDVCLKQIAIAQPAAEAYINNYKYNGIDNLERLIESEQELIKQVPRLRDKYSKEIKRHKLEIENIRNKDWSDKKIPLPEHTGYKQLCIIYWKQKKYSEIIKLAEDAKKQGWSGDWDKRIENARKQLGK